MAVVHPAYTGYFFDVRIFTITKQEFHFQAPDFPFVTGVTVNFQQTSDVAKISFSIDAPFTVGREMLNSDMFLAGNNVEVVIGYPNGPRSRPFYGFMHQGGIGLELSPNGLQGTINCNSFSRVKLYESRQKANSLKEAFETAVVGSGLYKEVVYEAGAEDAFAEFSTYKVQGRVQNQEMISLAHMLTNTWSAPDTDELLAGKVETLHVYSNAEIKSAKPTRKFVMRGQFSEADGSYPIENFGPELQPGLFAYSPAGASGLETTDINEEGEVGNLFASPEESEEKAGQDAITEEVDADVNVTAGQGGQEQAYNKALDLAREAPSTIHIPGPSDEAYRKATLRNLQTNLARREGWKANIASVGIPDIEGQEPIEVLGMGKIFDGVWTVDGVTHQCANGNFQTTLNCHSGLVKTILGANKETAG